VLKNCASKVNVMNSFLLLQRTFVAVGYPSFIMARRIMSPVQFKAGLAASTGAGTGAAVGSTAWTEERAHNSSMVTKIARMAMVRFCVFGFGGLICCLLVFVI
jgi:hypothetical protein